MTDHINAGDKNPAYATYVGRVGALALALGIGAAMATGHGLGLGVAYATEGDPSTDTSQDNDTNDSTGDDTGATPPAPSATAEAPGGSSQPRSPLARIANVPKMIFNATGGAQSSSVDRTQPRLPRLSTVLEDVASAVTNNLPKLPAPAQGAAPQANPGAGSAIPVTSRSASEGTRNLVPAVTSLPASVANEFKALVSLPAGGRTQTRPSLTPSGGVPSGIQRQALVDNGQQDVVQPSAALVQTPTNPPPINPVGVVTRLLTVALSAIVAPGPAAPTDPPLLLGVLAWARREIQLNFLNRTPNAIPDAVTTGEDPVTPVAGNVLTNDRQENPDGSSEKLVVTDARTQTTDKGTLVLNANGSYTYTPKLNANGQDVFTYTVSDEASRPHIHGLRGLLYGGGHTDTATLTINITPVNDAPIAGTDPGTTTVDEDDTLNGTLPSATDIDSTTLTYSGPTNGRTDHGTITITPTGGYTYKPDANYNGPDTITYTVTDNHPTDPRTDTGTLSVTVNPQNDAPVAGQDPGATTVDEDDTLNGTLPSATDIDSTTLTYSGPTNGRTDHGTITITPTGGYTYKPDANYNGPDTITYTVTDNHPTDPRTDTGTLSVTVNPQNDAPVAGQDPGATTVDEDDTLNGTLPSATDIDSTTLTYSGPTNGRTDHGTITITPTGGYTYKPDANYNGPDTITYTVTDNQGATDAGTLSVTVNPVSDDGFEGKTIDYTYFYPTVSVPYKGTTGDVTVGSNVEIANIEPDRPNMGTVDISEDRVLVTYNDYVTWSPGTFNGFRLSDKYETVNDIVGVAVVQNGNNAGFDSSRVTFDANNVYVNWQGLNFENGSQVEVQIFFA